MGKKKGGGKRKVEADSDPEDFKQEADTDPEDFKVASDYVKKVNEFLDLIKEKDSWCTGKGKGRMVAKLHKSRMLKAMKDGFRNFLTITKLRESVLSADVPQSLLNTAMEDLSAFIDRSFIDENPQQRLLYEAAYDRYSTRQQSSEVPSTSEPRPTTEVISLQAIPTTEVISLQAIKDMIEKSVMKEVCKAVPVITSRVKEILSDAVALNLRLQFQNSAKQVLKEGLEYSLIPSFERSCKTMFDQIDTAFRQGLHEYTSAGSEERSRSQPENYDAQIISPAPHRLPPPPAHLLNVVKQAENLMLERGDNKEYLPIEGLAAFNKATAELLFGAGHPVIEEQKVATIQGLSGTGSLRLAAALIERYFPGAKVLISAPTWANHKNIFNDAKVPWSEYRYYDPKTIGLDFEGMIADIKEAPEGSFILLHGCAHNPTGIDPTLEQWVKIADGIQEKNHIPFFDVAYQGFASGSLDEDAASVRLFAERGMEFFVAQSYSKNLGLYAGAVNVVCSSADAATRDYGTLTSNTTFFQGQEPVEKDCTGYVLEPTSSWCEDRGDATLFSEWKAEMEMVARRIKTVRQKLYDSLVSKDKSGKDWSFILKQIGMFSFTGLNKAQSDNMTNKCHVYMTKDGRISLAGLSLAKCEYLADAIIDSYHNVS